MFDRSTPWMTALCFIAGLSVLAGCASDNSGTRSGTAETAATPSGDSGSIAEGKLVVVPSSADFSSGTDASSERWSYEPGEFWTFEVVSVESNWVELAKPSSRGCYGTPPTLDRVDLSFYVQRDAISPVTTRTVSKDYGDGTSIELQPGVVVETGESGETLARLDGFAVPVSIDDDEVGAAYAKPPSAPAEAPEAEWFRAAGGLVIDGTHFSRDGSAPLRVVEKASAGDTSEKMHGRIVTRCGEVRALFNSPVGAEPPSDRAPELKAKFQVSYAAPGTALYWPGGEKAGTVRDEKWPLRVETRERDNRPCFSASFVELAPDSFTPERHFRICVDRDDLESPEEIEERAAEDRVDQTGGGHVSVLQTDIEIRLQSLDGGHKWDQIKRPVASVQNDIEKCYRREVSPDDKFGGTLALTVAIGASGEVDGVEVGESELDRSSVETCVADKLRRVSFPAGSAPSDLGVELVFSLQDE